MNVEIPQRIKKLIKKSSHQSILVVLILSLFILAVGGGVRLFSSIFDEREEPSYFDAYGDNNSGYSTVDVQFISYPFASYRGNSAHQLYVIMDLEGYTYIVCMTDKQFEAFEDVYDYTFGDEEAPQPEAVPLNGVPQAIDEELKDEVLEFSGSFFGEDMITDENFDDWYGLYYLDATKTPVSSTKWLSNLLMVCGFVLLLVSLLRLFEWRRARRTTVKTLAKPGIESDLIKADQQLDGAYHLKKPEVYLTRDYLISYHSGFDLINVSQIVSVKEHSRISGPSNLHFLEVATNDGQTHPIAVTGRMTKAWKQAHEELLSKLKAVTSSFPVFDNSNPDAWEVSGNETKEEGAAAQALPPEFYESSPPVQGAAATGSLLFGVIGAFLFSLVGVVLWIVIGKLGFIAGIAGYVIMAAAMRGYQAFGRAMDKKGAVISFLVTIIMIFVASWGAYWLEFYTAFSSNQSGHISVFSVFSEMPSLMSEFDMWRSFFMDLAIGYALSIWACSSTLKSLFSSQ